MADISCAAGRFHPKYYLINEYKKTFSREFLSTRSPLRERVFSFLRGIVHTGGIIPSGVFLMCNLGEKIFGLGKAVTSDPKLPFKTGPSLWKKHYVKKVQELGDAAAAVVAFPFLRVALIVKDFSAAIITPKIVFKNQI